MNEFIEKFTNYLLQRQQIYKFFSLVENDSVKNAVVSEIDTILHDLEFFVKVAKLNDVNNLQ